MTIEERIKEVAKRKYFDFFVNGFVFCKGCGQIIKQKSPMSHYREITITCDDGSAHVTHICSDCLKMITMEDLDDYLLIDGLQMIKEAEQQGQVLNKSMVDLMLNRKATGVA